MSDGWIIALLIAGSVVGVGLIVALVVFVLMPVGRGVGFVASHIWRFVRNETRDIVRLTGTLLVAPIFALLWLAAALVGNRQARQRFGLALHDEGLRGVVCFYRVMLGHPARLLGLAGAVEGIEQRLPGALTGAFGDAVSPRNALFPGYVVTGTISAGGSGAKLYIARPEGSKLRELRREALARGDADDISTVVIKSFTQTQDSSIAGIVRESRALESGKRLGLILDHALTPDRFWYAMKYVEGVSLRVFVSRLHQEAGDAGLDDQRLRTCLLLLTDLLRTLETYHAQGLWHKDVKPDNVLVGPAAPGQRPRAHLVDLGLVSSLRSAMTLTTHGTEYFRDPEMVRMALRGVKVHEVDGARFDVYAAGAVLYAMIEDSFPAQGSLSPISRRCPGAVAWIIRRAMAEYAQRYPDVRTMLADVEAVLRATTLDEARVASLPSLPAPAEGSA